MERASIYYVNHTDEITIFLGHDMDIATAQTMFEFMGQDDSCYTLWFSLAYSQEEAEDYNYPIYNMAGDLLWRPKEDNE